MAAIQIVRIDAEVPLRCFRAKSGNWIGVCDPLKLTVQSATWAELMEDFGATLNGVLTDLLQTNDLDRFLRERGWRAMGPIPERPGNVSFDLPFVPAMMANRGSQRNLHQ